MERLSSKSGVFLRPVSRLRRVASGGTFACLLRLSVLVLLILLVAAPGRGQTLSSISITPGEPTVVIGGTTQLTATATWSNSSTTNVSGSVTWSSSDPRMVNVSSGGAASGFATGNVAVTATYQGHSATATVASSIGNIQWSGPINITQGGTYSGNWKSTNPKTAAVTISTTAPVIIENSYVTGPADLINDPDYGNNLTVKNVIGIGVNPNVSGQGYGVFVDAQNSVLLDVENCYFENVQFGVYLRGYTGNRNGTQTITILNNRGRNILGVESNGNNGSLPGETNWQWAHAIQLSGAYGVPGIKIAWNEIVNYPSQSLVNENINMFDSGGTASSPAQIHDNYVQGAYAYNPAVDAYNGGGFTTDGSASDTAQTASSFNNIYNNQIVDTVNVGIEIGTGHDNAAYNNRVISAGLLPNGTKIPSQNVGLSLYDVYGNIANGSMYNNNMYSNTVGWMCWAARCAWDGYRNDEWFPLNNGYYATNTTISANPITLAMESTEYQTWLSKISSSGLVVGPQDSSSGSSGSGSGSGSGGGSGSGSTSSSAISTTAWYTIENTNSTLCLGSASTTAGAALQQNTCGTSQLQQWQFQPAADSGYYQVVNRSAASPSNMLVWDVTGGAWQTADGALIQLYTSKVETNEEWMPVSVGNGAYKFVVKNSGKCLDVPGASSAVLLHLQQYTCNGTGAQSYTLKQQ
jgi:Ricin-type beta-trefoil lectin domain/Bacterial Ig-like domain (group 2)